MLKGFNSDRGTHMQAEEGYRTVHTFFKPYVAFAKHNYMKFMTDDAIIGIKIMNNVVESLNNDPKFEFTNNLAFDIQHHLKIIKLTNYNIKEKKLKTQ